MLKADWDAFARRFGYSSEQAMFEELYVQQNVSVIELGRRLGFTASTISRRLRLNGILVRSRGGANNEFTQKLRLWRFDQRMVVWLDANVIANTLSVDIATLKSYLKDIRR